MTENDRSATGADRIGAYIETVRSFADETGAILGISAAALLGYLRLGDWMLKTGLIGADGHFAGVVVAFICALLLTMATAMMFVERLDARAGHL